MKTWQEIALENIAKTESWHDRQARLQREKRQPIPSIVAQQFAEARAKVTEDLRSEADCDARS